MRPVRLVNRAAQLSEVKLITLGETDRGAGRANRPEKLALK